MRIVITFLFIIIFSNNYSQTSVTNKVTQTYIPKDSLKKEFVGKTLIDDQVHIWTSPFRIKTKDLAYLLPIGVVAGLTINYDEDIHRNVMQFKNDNSWVSKVSPQLTHGGELPVVGGVTFLFYAGGYLLKDDKAMQTGALAVNALVDATIVVEVLKTIAGRQRPRVGEAKNVWNFIPASLKQFTGENPDKYNSFPSGHTITAFTLATVIAQQYKETIYVPIIAYTIATGVGLSRTTENAHWLSDVMIGAALGYGIGKFVAQKHKKTNWVIFPISWNNNLMLTGIYRL